MALTDIVFDDQETQAPLNELPYNSFNGALNDIDTQDTEDLPIVELKQKPFVNNTIKVR